MGLPKITIDTVRLRLHSLKFRFDRNQCIDQRLSVRFRVQQIPTGGRQVLRLRDESTTISLSDQTWLVDNHRHESCGGQHQMPFIAGRRPNAFVHRNHPAVHVEQLVQVEVHCDQRIGHWRLGKS